VGAIVTVTGSSGTYPAAVLYVSPTQINFQIPWEVSGSSQVTLKVDFVSIPLALSATAPAIFSLNSQGTGPGAILISNTDQFAQPVGSVQNSSSQPVSRGQFISIYATGLGALTTAPPPDGSPPASQMTIAATATVSIGGFTVTPSFAGLAPGFVGLYQVDAQVPAGITPGSAVPVFMTVGGVASNTVTIAVQ
jgi:minor extracellular serine protease Vpr